jgi:hypothetical protein
VSRAALAAASQPIAAAAAQRLLDAGASAADAVVAGFFADAGRAADVLLAPAVAVVAGAGVGGRAFDGRAVQPGRGAARPRGVPGGAPVPPAARAAAPGSLAMLALLHAYRGRASLRDLVKPGVEAARAAGASARAELLERIGKTGVLALRSDDVTRPLLSAFGPAEGGMLTVEDLTEGVPVEATATKVPGVAGYAFVAPWSRSEASPQAVACEVVVAADGRDGLAALAYEPVGDELAAPALELTMPRCAVPVLRGVTRVAPGTPLPASAPVAIATAGTRSEAGPVWLAFGLPGASGSLDALPFDCLWGGQPIETALAELREAAGAREVHAVLRDARGARLAR